MSQPFCVYCLGPLPNGSPVCSAECDEGWWRIVPTISGDLFEMSEEPEDESQLAPHGIPPERRGLEAPPSPNEAANWRDRAYISGEKLRRHLLEANP